MVIINGGDAIADDDAADDDDRTRTDDDRTRIDGDDNIHPIPHDAEEC